MVAPNVPDLLPDDLLEEVEEIYDYFKSLDPEISLLDPSDISKRDQATRDPHGRTIRIRRFDEPAARPIPPLEPIVRQKIKETIRHCILRLHKDIADRLFLESDTAPIFVDEYRKQLEQILEDQKYLRSCGGLKLSLPEDFKENLKARIREMEVFLNDHATNFPKEQLNRLRRLLKEFLEEVDKGESNCKLLGWLSGRFCKNLKALRLVGLLTLGPAIDASITAYDHLWNGVESIFSKIDHYYNDNNDSSESEKNPNEQIQSLRDLSNQAISAPQITYDPQETKDSPQPPDDSSQPPSL